MKKSAVILMCIIMMLSVCLFPVSAAGTGSLSGVTSVKSGSNAEFIVSLSGCPDATSASVAVSFDGNFSLVSGTWLKSGSLVNFDTSKNKGALSGLSSPNINGNLFKLTLKAGTPSAAAQNVSITVTAKNESNEIYNQTLSKKVTITCATHSFGAWSKVDANKHTRTCSACGAVETVNHTWNSGTVTKKATCKEAGTKEITCTACGAKKTETIAKTTTHSWGKYQTTKEATCTVAGTETATCTVCGKTQSRSIPAKGHSFGAWMTKKEATCTAGGIETRTCAKCKAEESRATASLGHSFSKPTVIKEPTCTAAGEQTGECTRCGQTTSQEIKPTGHSFGGWTDETAATCTAGGKQKRICEKCKTEESRTTEPLGHDFEKPTVVKEATVFSTGLAEGKCKRCGQTTQQVIPCGYKDDKTGVSVETAAGVFGQGTTLGIESVDPSSEVYGSAKNVLSDVAKEFALYQVNAAVNGGAATPNGKVKISFLLPAGYGKDTAVYFVGEDGKYEKIEPTVSEDGKTVTVETEKLGLFSLCKPRKADDKAAETEQTGTDRKKDAGSDSKLPENIWLYAAIAAAVLLAVIIIAIVAGKKKNKHK